MTAHRREELLHMFNEVAPIAKTFGMRLTFTDDERAVVTLPYNPGLDHAMEGIHGGVYATLLDTAGWFTAAVTHGESSWIATSEMSIHFLKPSKQSDLRAEGRMLKRGRRQDIVEMLLYDGTGELIGHAVGTFMVLPHIPFGPSGGRKGNET